MPRTTTIAVNDNEQNLMNEARMEMFQTVQVPYGVLIQRLIDAGTDIDVQEFMTEDEGDTE
jgi:hypothetical protein